MRKIAVSFAVGVILAMLAPALAAAQQPAKPMTGPPKVLHITREEVKPGKAYVHNQHETAWTQALIKAKYPTHMLVISSVTGPPEDWYMTGFDSFAAWEKNYKNLEENAALHTIMQGYSAKESDFLSEIRFSTARYRPELSYRPDFKLGEYRYFNVTIVRYRLGHSPDEVGRILATAREKANIDTHIVAYQVTSGAPVGTYIYFSPVKSLDVWDQPPNQAYQEALKEGKFDEAVEKSVQNVEFRLFAFNPQQSYVPESVVSADPAFWHPKMTKPAAAGKAAPAAKTEGKKGN